MLDCLSDIQHNHAFDLLSDRELEILNEDKTTVHYKKNEIILKQGTRANTLVFSKTGLFKLQIDGDQKSVILTLKGGQVFLGLSSLFYVNNVHLYTVTALEDCEVDIYNSLSFKKILAENVDFSNEIIKYLNHNSARIFKRFINMAEKNSRGKVANMLVCFANSVYNDTEYVLTLSRQELAEYLGLSTENIIRVLKEFEADDLILVEGKKIKLLNTEVLHKICNYG